MKKINILTIIAILTLLQISCTDSTSGGETLNEKIALYMPDGITPAVDAAVKFFFIGDTSATPIFQTQTDAEGRYSVSGVTSTGYYNVIAEYEDSLFTMQDTVYISQESNLVKDDTLNNPGSISGIVALQPNHSHLLDNVYVIALGMGRAVNVDSTGWFTMTKLAPGDYNLQVDTDIEKYGPKFVDVTISSSVNDTIADTITLPYSGVPVVSNIRCEYDTLNGIVSVNWNKSAYENVYSYVIFKKSIDSLFFPKDPIGWVSSTDTNYKDTIFTKPVLDTTSLNYDYTVAIIDSSTTTGLINSFLKVVGISPLKVSTNILIQTYNKETQLLIDTFSTNDTLQIVLKASNSYRPYKSVTWSINHPDSIIRQTNFDSISFNELDTLLYHFPIEDNYNLYISIEDMAGTLWYDSTIIPIWQVSEPPILHMDSIFAFTAYLRWNMNTDNNFKQYDIYYSATENGPFTLDTSLYSVTDTTIIINNLISDSIYYFRVDVSDSTSITTRSNIIFDTTMNIISKLNVMPSTTSHRTMCTINNKLYLFNLSDIGICGNYDSNNISWSEISPMILPRRAKSISVVNDKIYAIGGTTYTPNMEHQSLIEEYDPISNKWISKNSLTDLRAGHTSCVYNNEIYIFGGRSSSSIYQVEKYDPAKDSIEIISTSPEMPFSSKPYAFTFENKIYICYSTLEVFDFNPLTKEWGTRIPLPNLEIQNICQINENLYIIGWNKIGSHDVIYKYNLNTGAQSAIYSKVKNEESNRIILDGILCSSIENNFFICGGWVDLGVSSDKVYKFTVNK